MMSTGIIRRMGDLGRIVIPKEIRENLGIEEGTPMEIMVNDEGNIVLKKIYLWKRGKSRGSRKENSRNFRFSRVKIRNPWRYSQQYERLLGYDKNTFSNSKGVV